jgi:hypothetical protein
MGENDMTGSDPKAKPKSRPKAPPTLKPTAQTPAPPPAQTPAPPSKPKPQPTQARAWLGAALEASAAGPFCEVVTVSPEMARALLDRNEGNRNYSKRQVAQIADDIRTGRWQFNGESVVIASSGELNDGQHRLQAIVEAGIAVPLVLVGGATRESRMTLDMGKNRNIADYLHLMGVTNPNVVASVARLALAYEMSKGQNFASIGWISKAEGIDRGLNDKFIQDAANWGAKHQAAVSYFIPPSPLAFCYYVLRQVGDRQGVTYMEALVEGANLPRHSPVLTVRRYLPTFPPRHREPKIALVLRGWNLWVRGEEANEGEIHGRYPLPELLRPERPDVDAPQ